MANKFNRLKRKFASSDYSLFFCNGIGVARSLIVGSILLLLLYSLVLHHFVIILVLLMLVSALIATFSP